MHGPVVQFPDRLLRNYSIGISPDSDSVWIQQTISKMFMGLNAYDGLGISAVQVGEPVRLIIIKNKLDNTPLVMLNPVIIDYDDSGYVDSCEGCLSIKHGSAYRVIQRHERVAVQYQDTGFHRHNRLFLDRDAIVVQHEIDHLNGVLFIDYLSKLKRDMFFRKHKIIGESFA